MLFFIALNKKKNPMPKSPKKILSGEIFLFLFLVFFKSFFKLIKKRISKRIIIIMLKIIYEFIVKASIIIKNRNRNISSILVSSKRIKNKIINDNNKNNL
jgi:hypothetical protein